MPNKIYLLANESGKPNNIYDEYIYMDKFILGIFRQ